MARLARLGMTLLLWAFAATGSLRAESLSRLLLEFGDTRTALHGLLIERPSGGAAVAARLADLLARNPRRGQYPHVIRPGWSISPILRHEGNVNDGIDADVIWIAGLPFVIDPDVRARSAMTAGMVLQASVGLALAPGWVLLLNGRSEWRKALGRESFQITEHGSGAALSYTSETLWHVTAAAQLGLRESDAARRRARTVSLTLGKVFGSRNVQDLSAILARVAHDGDGQNRLRIDWSWTRAGFGQMKFGVQLARQLEGRMHLRHAQSLSWANVLWGQPTRFELATSLSAGGSHLGKPRKDRLDSLRIERRLSPRLNGYIAVARRRSSAEIHGGTTLDLGFVMRGWTPE